MKNQSKIMLIMMIMAVITTPVLATTTTKGVNASGDNLFWIVLTIALTLFFASRSVMSSLLTNPLLIILLIIGLIGLYIIFAAISIVTGVGDRIDSLIQGTVDILTNIGGT